MIVAAAEIVMTVTTTRASSLIKPKNASPKAVHFIIVCYMHSTKVKLILIQQWYARIIYIFIYYHHLLPMSVDS